MNSLLPTTEAAQKLGVGEADMLASLANGSLKGKKISSQWHITKQALEKFLKG